MSAAADRPSDRAGSSARSIEHRTVRIAVGPDTVVEGELHVPQPAQGLVVFAHGSGSSRHSRRNVAVAATLQQAGLATLLIDLLTAEEEEAERYTRHLRFDIELLAGRLQHAAQWAADDEQTAALPIGYFGASTGAAAALVAAARERGRIAAVVSRGGRPDLAGDHLPDVEAPTLLIVGGLDHQVIEMNREAEARLRAETRFEIVPGATHLFEEPGTLDAVAQLATDWFRQHLSASPASG